MARQFRAERKRTEDDAAERKRDGGTGLRISAILFKYAPLANRVAVCFVSEAFSVGAGYLPRRTGDRRQRHWVCVCDWFAVAVFLFLLCFVLEILLLRAVGVGDGTRGG